MSHLFRKKPVPSLKGATCPTGPRRAQDRSELLRLWRGPSLRRELPEGMGIGSSWEPLKITSTR